MGCSTLIITVPKTQVQPFPMPTTQASVIQTSITLPTAQLKDLLLHQIAVPLLSGTTPKYNFKVANRKPIEDKNWLDHLAQTLLEWVDETIDASVVFCYRLELAELDLWFEANTVHTNFKIDVQLEAQWENGIKWQSEKQLSKNNLSCPLQLQVHIDGTIELTKEAQLNLIIYEDEAQFEITKFCSSKILKQVNWPELLQPIVKPVFKNLSQTINKVSAQQLQRLLNSSTGQSYRNFQPIIDQTADYLNTPYALQKGVWLQPNVQQVFVSPLYGVGKGLDNRLELSIGVVAQPLVVLQKHIPKIEPLPPITFGVRAASPQSQLCVKGQLPLREAAVQLQQYLRSYLQQHYAHYGYTIGQVNIYPKGFSAIIAVELLRSNNHKKKATLYLSGIPQFDTTKQEFYLEDLNFTVQSKNILLHFAKWLHQGRLMEQLQKNARFDASQEIQTIQKQLQNIDIHNSLGRIYGSLNDLQVVQTSISKAYFEAYVLATGVLQAEIYWQPSKH